MIAAVYMWCAGVFCVFLLFFSFFYIFFFSTFGTPISFTEDERTSKVGGWGRFHPFLVSIIKKNWKSPKSFNHLFLTSYSFFLKKGDIIFIYLD
jgi:ABC-type Fe3+ transport system permease subunit